MSTIYEKAPTEVTIKARELIELYHSELGSADVKIDYVFARAERDADNNPKAPALKKGGYEVAGLARIINAKDRVMGRGDGEIVIDADEWERMSEAGQNALLDHELEHFVVKKDEFGLFLRDDQHRPKLKMKLHDYDFGWFDVIAKRHGQASCEVKQARQMYEQAGQYYFPFLKDSLVTA